MHVPGFSAEASLYKTRGHYHSMAMSGCSEGRRDVISQLKGGGGLGTLEDYYYCAQDCRSAHDACVERCEGLRCLNCDGELQACLLGCAGDIA
jgi:hypothetical protein